jgi:hypothetical protein
MNFSFRQKWLIGIGLIIMIFGFATVFLLETPIFPFFNHLIHPVFWGPIAVDESTGNSS